MVGKRILSFSAKEVEELEQAINNCYQMYCNVAEACLYDEEKLDKLCIPKEMRPFIRQSWEDDDLSLYGRFDFAYVDGVPKLLEFNADTPTTLIESALVQWQWKEAVFPEADQFNSLHEALIQSWKDIHDVYKCDIYHFASLTDCPEDYSTMAYIMSTAYDAGLRTAELDLRDIAIGECLMTPDGEPINCLFKLYPWETMFKENMGGCVTDMCWIEPLWKCLMSNKALLPFLYEMYPDSPYVLPAYFEADKLKSYCKSRFFSGRMQCGTYPKRFLSGTYIRRIRRRRVCLSGTGGFARLWRKVSDFGRLGYRRRSLWSGYSRTIGANYG